MQHSVTKEQSTKNTPTPEEIRKYAFEIHIERGGIHGCDLDDWLQAERELQEKYNGDRAVPPPNRKARKRPRRMSMAFALNTCVDAPETKNLSLK